MRIFLTIRPSAAAPETAVPLEQFAANPSRLLAYLQQTMMGDHCSYVVWASVPVFGAVALFSVHVHRQQLVGKTFAECLTFTVSIPAEAGPDVQGLFALLRVVFKGYRP